MVFPHRTFLVIAAVASYFAVRFPQSHVVFLGSPGYVGAFLQVFGIQVLGWLVWFNQLWPRYFSPLRHLPGPTNSGFFHGQWALLRAEKTGRPLHRWINDIPHTGLIRYLYILNMELVMVCSPAALKELLVTRCYEYEKPTPLLRLALQFFGPGMPFVEGDTHKHQRKMMAPAFSFKHIKDLYPTFWELSRDISNILVGEVKKAAGEPHTTNGISYQVAPDQAVVEIVAWWKKITLDIMGVAGMGHDFEGRKHDENELCQAYYKMFRPTWGHAISTFIRIVVPLWMFPYIPLPQNHTIEESRHTINNHCRMLIRQKKAQLAEGKLTDLDILSCAIQSGAFDEETLVPQITIFLLAGHESSSVAMSWATYALAQYPEVQKRLREEVRAVLPSPYGSEPVTSLDIDKVPYITAVCNEVMRFYDVFVWTFREARVDTELVGQRIPKGTQLVVPVASIHRDRSIWGDDADVFNPDRWMEKRNAGVSTNFAVMTFIHGPRTCIGESFARAEFACLLAAFAGRFEWELNDPRELVDENYKLAGGFGVGPVNGLDIRLRVVDGW